MEFLADKFMAAKFTPRTEAVRVPDLAHFFDLEEGEVPTWTVRALSAEEIAKTTEAEDKNQKLGTLVEAMVSPNKTRSQRIEDIRLALGITGDVHPILAKQIEMLVLGSVIPEINHAQAAKLASERAGDFLVLVRTISALTAKGNEYTEKSQPSGETKASDQP